MPLCNIPSIRFGAGFLARTFARLVKDLVDICNAAGSGKSTQVTLDKLSSSGMNIVCLGQDRYNEIFSNSTCTVLVGIISLKTTTKS